MISILAVIGLIAIGMALVFIATQITKLVPSNFALVPVTLILCLLLGFGIFSAVVYLNGSPEYQAHFKNTFYTALGLK